MEIRGKSLDDARVARVRARFERDRTKPHRLKKPILLTFDELLDHFANDCMTFADIGKIIVDGGMTRERVRQLYNRYFVGLFPTRKNGRKRQKVCILKRRHIAKKEAMTNFSDDELLAYVAQKAQLAGYIVHRKVENRGSSAFANKNILLMNGSSYTVHFVQSALARSHDSPALFFSVGFSSRILKSTKGAIIVTRREGVEHIFIVPSREVLAKYGSGKHRVTVCIAPERRPVYKNNVPRLDWWKYENAWPPQKEKIVGVPLTQAVEAVGAGK